MKALLLAPHNDDESLFAGVICQRERPQILICLDSYIQPKRGEFGCSANERFMESCRAAAVLGCRIERLGLHDDTATEELIVAGLQRWLRREGNDPEVVYTPAIQGGNIHHDMVGRAALAVFPGKVRQYATYTKTELHTTGTVEIAPTAEELRVKDRALSCYDSQIRINRPHFEAVAGRSEWLMGPC